MSFTDKTLKCADCSADFVFTANEQEFYSSKGFQNEPKRCPDCRAAKKAQGRGGGGRGFGSRGGGGRGFGGGGGRGRGDGPTQKFAATCSRCGTQFDAPFEPKPGRSIFCRDCFKQERPPR